MVSATKARKSKRAAWWAGAVVEGGSREGVLEGWLDIARTVMEQRPLAWIFFTGYILVATFMVLNLFIGVVVGAIQSRIADELVGRRDAHPTMPRLAEAYRRVTATLRAPSRERAVSAVPV